MNENTETEGFLFQLWVEEWEEVKLIQQNIPLFTVAAILKVTVGEFAGYDLEILLESPTQLFMLGKYVGCDKKRIYNKDY